MKEFRKIVETVSFIYSLLVLGFIGAAICWIGLDAISEMFK